MAKKVNFKFQVGDIFSIKITENEMIFGRILFDVNNQYLKKGLKGFNYLDYFNNCFLIETFIGVFPSFDNIDIKKKAVISSFIPEDFFEDFDCNIIDNIKVNIEEVSFPEVLSTFNSNYFFSVGELSLLINLTDKEYDDIGIYPTFGSGYWEIVATLDFSKRLDLIEDGDRMDNYFENSDLRYSPLIRNKIYSLIGEAPDQSYYELALKYGFDLTRLY